jgi:hypothetical protein
MDPSSPPSLQTHKVVEAADEVRADENLDDDAPELELCIAQTRMSIIALKPSAGQAGALSSGLNVSWKSTLSGRRASFCATWLTHSHAT